MPESDQRNSTIIFQVVKLPLSKLSSCQAFFSPYFQVVDGVRNLRKSFHKSCFGKHTTAEFILLKSYQKSNRIHLKIINKRTISPYLILDQQDFQLDIIRDI